MVYVVFIYHLSTYNSHCVPQVSDAREETEEQRQIAAQMKKRTQRLQSEMNDLKILLEEQSARNSLLEKKQRK